MNNIRKKLPTESEIIKNWKNAESPLVSIACTVYNHEQFLDEAMSGFLIQKTNFPFEIIIHDDASTDSSPQIIESYATKYPSIISTIYQNENQYSKGIKPFINIIFPKCKGEYIARCEGDDYWNDQDKLQSQIDLLEKNSNYSACFHPVYWLEKNKINENIYSPLVVKSHYNLDNVLENILQITVCSTVFRKSTLSNVPSSLLNLSYWDNVLHFLNAKNGNIGFINKPMATYRRHASGYYSGESEFNRVVKTIETWRAIEREFNLTESTPLSKRYLVLMKKLNELSNSELIKLNKLIESNPNKRSESIKAKNKITEAEIISHFTNAQTLLSQKNFSIAENEMRKYKTKVNYNSFEKTDNRINKNPVVSVIIVAYNTNQLLIDCINSLKNQTNKNFEIIIVDNGKNEFVREKLLSLKLLYIKCPTNLILSEGRNVGAYFAEGKIIAFLDDDAIAHQKWIESIISVFNNQNIYCVRGKVFPKEKNSFMNVKPHYNLGENYLLINYIDTEGNSAFRKEIYRELYGMNPLLFGAEGFELSYRIQKYFGFGKIIYSPDMIIYHDYALSSDKLEVKTTRHKLMNDYLRWKFSDIEEFRQPLQKPTNIFSDNKKNIFISICIPTYNRGKYIAETIESVLKQNYFNYEIVVVDDGSTDNTKEIIEEINSDKIRYIYKNNTGAPDTRNRCIKEAKGEYILWLDSDDLLAENVLNTYIETLSLFPGVDVVYGELISIGKSDYHYKYQDWHGKNEKMLEFLFVGSPMPHGGSLIKKRVYEEIGVYNISFKRAHDYEFWSRLAMANKYNCKYIPQIIYKYRIHENNITGELSNNTDYNYEANILDNILNKIDVKKLFTQLDWTNSENYSFAIAYTKVSLRFFEWKNIDYALKYLLDSLDYGFTDDQEKMLEIILNDKKVSKYYPQLFNKLKNKYSIIKKSKPGTNDNIKVKSSKKVNENVGKERFVNICMVTYNRLEFTKQSVDSLIKFTKFPHTITVIDNNSQDGTKEYLTNLKENGIIKNLVLLEENVGVAKASNLAWSLEPNAEYYLKFDNDIVIEKDDWLEQMVKVIEAIPEAGAVAYNFEPVSYSHSFVNNVKVRIKKEGNLGGACILIPNRTKDILGYWNEDFGLYGEEDADYGYRISSAGLLNIYMDDENIGKHLPGGKAAAIDPKTLKAISNEENNYEKDYREWKDKLRVNNVIGGKYYQVINEYITGKRKLYCSSNFVKEHNKRKIALNQSVSIIIPVYNKSELTRVCLDSIYKSKNNTDFEILVIDNNSTDDTPGVIDEFQRKYNNLFYYRNTENLGFAKANNYGVKLAKNEFVVLLNNDTEVNDGWLDNLFITIISDTQIASVGSKLLFADNTVQHAGVAIIRDLQYGDPLVARHLNYKSHKDNPEVNQVMEYQALTAACLLLRKSAFEEVKGFDEEYWNGYEDIDLCFKLREKGYKLVYQPNSIVYHHESQSGPERFTKVNNNIKLLHQKWLNKIIPDFEISKDGKIEQNFPSQIKPYSLKELSIKNKLLCSIVVPTFNQFNFTKEFLKSLLSKTNNNFEIIIVDNASSDNTIEYLNSLSEKEVRIKRVQNNENLGFPIAVNQGIKKAKGNFILIANNDIVLTNNWLERMIEVAESDPKIGIVGPISNSVSGVQIDTNANYKSIDEMHRYAKKVSKESKGQVFEFPRVAFLCTLIKRDVIEKIGGLDERFSPGNFEDDDFCLRAQIAGYKTVIAKDVFIHHYGSKSFKADGEKKYFNRLEINRKLFVDKWGADPDEIWLKNKPIVRRNIKYNLDNNLFVQSFERAMTLMEDKDYTIALSELENALQNFENIDREKYPKLQIDELLNLIANTAVQTGNLEKANYYFSEELKINPNSSRACVGIAQTYYESELYNESKSMFEWALKYEPFNKNAFKGLTIVNQKLNLNDYDFTLNEVDKPSEYLLEAESLIGQNELDKAIEILMYIIQNDPFNIDALNNLAVAGIMKENYEEAAIVFDRIYALDPTNEVALDNMNYLQSLLQSQVNT